MIAENPFKYIISQSMAFVKRKGEKQNERIINNSEERKP